MSETESGPPKVFLNAATDKHLAATSVTRNCDREFHGIERLRKSLSSLLTIAVVAIFNLAKLGAKLLAARKTTTNVMVLAWHHCHAAVC